MAHTARINSTVDLLINNITGLTPTDAEAKRLKESATKILRSNTHVRANQFDVRNKYEGLIEKFSILNREDLAGALQERWDELPENPSQSQPEVLLLLLHLSDRPLEKTDVDAALKSCQRPASQRVDLTWDEIIADDPFSDDEIWKNIERGYHSSGDDVSIGDELTSDDTTTTQATSVDEDFYEIASSHLITCDTQTLAHYEQHKNYLDAAREATCAVSELWIIREVLSMLHGLPTTLFKDVPRINGKSMQFRFFTTTLTASTTQVLLSKVADLGASLQSLRQWARDPAPASRTSGHAIPYIRTLQCEVADRLSSFSSRLASIEQKFLLPSDDVVVSLLQVYDEVTHLADPLKRLSRIIMEAAQQHTINPFSCLDFLYDEICASQLAGLDDLVSLLAKLLFTATGTYLRSLELWISEGRVKANDLLLFVDEVSADAWTLGSLWRSRFRLRRRSDGTMLCPKFMHPLADKIFSMGKSRALMFELDKASEEALKQSAFASNFRAFAQPPHTSLADSLLPFPEIMSEALRSWLSDGPPDPINALRTSLVRDCHLLELVDAMQSLYHARDGTTFQTFANALYTRTQRGHRQWNDSFLLTELAQETLGSMQCVDASRIAIHFPPEYEDESGTSSIRALSRVSLTYELSWPIQNITHEATLTSDAKVFALLLQVYHAQTLLRAEYYDIRTSRGITSGLRGLLPLRQRLLWFTGMLYAHITTTTLILSTKLRSDLESAVDIDAMAAAYADYKVHLETSLLLTANLTPIRETVTKILQLCEHFDTMWQQKQRKIPDTGTRDRQSSRLGIETLRADFDKHFRFLLAGIQSVSRAKGEAALERLAESLEWGNAGT